AHVSGNGTASETRSSSPAMLQRTVCANSVCESVNADEGDYHRHEESCGSNRDLCTWTNPSPSLQISVPQMCRRVCKAMSFSRFLRAPRAIERSLSALPLVVILDVENTKQVRIEFCNLAHRVRHELAESAVSGVVPYGVPAVLVRDEEPD